MALDVLDPVFCASCEERFTWAMPGHERRSYCDTCLEFTEILVDDAARGLTFVALMALATPGEVP